MATTTTKRRTYHLYQGDLQRTTNNHSTSRSSATTTTTHGRNSIVSVIETSSSEMEEANSLEEIQTVYRQALQRPMPPWHVQEVSEAISRGVSPYYYQYALREAASAPRPSWQYAQAIVRRLCREHVPELQIMYALGMSDLY